MIEKAVNCTKTVTLTFIGLERYEISIFLLNLVHLLAAINRCLEPEHGVMYVHCTYNLQISILAKCCTKSGLNLCEC